VMRHREPTRSGKESNALTWAKKFYYWHPGERKSIKRRFNRRVRRNTRLELKALMQQG